MRFLGKVVIGKKGELKGANKICPYILSLGLPKWTVFLWEIKVI